MNLWKRLFGKKHPDAARTVLQSTTENDRIIRVFISSTFRDMHEERNHLVTVVFPQLRRLCETRGVTWGEVDLRWGVPDEAAAEGKVLPICLEEIHRCRPYFIGLLGERYGWIPQSIPEELLEKEPWLLTQFEGRKSVTELEILHGVLQNPDLADHAFFYFRDPAWISRLRPGSKRDDFVSENAGSTEKLRKLKDLIRASGLPVRENYPTPEALGSFILEDLTAVINQLYPEGSQPDPLTREALDHAAYARSRTNVYIGRPEYFSCLDAHAAGKGNQPLVIVGESGSGKSALLANWAAGFRKSNPDIFMLEHYIGATPYSADWVAMVQRIMGEFKQRFDINLEIPDKPDALRKDFPNWLYIAAAKNRIILVLDALNHLKDKDSDSELLWLPPKMPENIRLIISVLPGRAVDEAQKRGWQTLVIMPLTLEERRKLVRDYLAQYSKSLNLARTDRIAAAQQSANPIYLRVLLDELRLFGQYEGLDERISYYLEAESPYKLYRKVIARWEQDYGIGTTLVSDTLSLIWAARRGLSESELLDALSREGRPLPRAAWSPLFIAMSDALVNRGGLLTFAHDFLREAACDAYLPTELHQQKTHLRLADYFQRQPSGPRRMDELPWQLLQAEAWSALEAHLTDLPFFVELWNQNPNDVLHCWAQLEGHSRFTIRESYGNIIRIDMSEEEAEYGKEQKIGCYPPAVQFAISGLMKATGHWEEAYLLRKLLLETARIDNDPQSVAACLGNLGVLARMKGDLIRALQLHQEEKTICRKSGNLHELATCLYNLGVVHRMMGSFPQALAAHEEQQRIGQQAGDVYEQFRAFSGIANVKMDMEDFSGAEEALREVERLEQQIGYGSNMEIRRYFSNVLLKQGRVNEAEQLFTKWLEDTQAIGDPYDIGICLHGLAIVHHTRGDLNGALELVKKEAELCCDLGDQPGLAAALTEQAGLLVELGYWDDAIAQSIKAEEILRMTGERHRLVDVLIHHFSAISKQGNIEAARRFGQEVLQLSTELDLTQQQFNILLQLSMLEKSAGKLPKALKRLEKAERLCRQQKHPDNLQKCLQMQAVLLVLLERNADALHKCEEAIRICQEVDLQEALAEAKKIRRTLQQHKRFWALTSVPKEVESERDRLRQQINQVRSAGDYQTAMRLFEKLEAFCRQHQDNGGLQEALYHQGNWLYEQQQFNEALEKYQALEAEAIRIDNCHGFAIALSKQGMVARRERRLEDAERLSHQAIELFNSLNDEYEVCKTKGNLALIIEDKGDISGALRLHQECEATARRMGDLEALQSSLGNQAAILADMGQVDRAAALLSEQGQVCRQSADVRQLAQVIVNQGILTIRGLHRLSEGLRLLADGCRRCIRQHALPAYQQALSVIKSEVAGLALPIIKGQMSQSDERNEQTLTLLSEFLQFGLEFQETDVFVWSAQALALSYISCEKQAEAQHEIETAIVACRERKWQEPMPRLEEIQVTVRLVPLVDEIDNQISADLQRNTVQSLINALFRIDGLYKACQNHNAPEILSKIDKMIEVVFQKLGSFGKLGLLDYPLFSLSCSHLEKSLRSMRRIESLSAYNCYKAEYHWKLEEYGHALRLMSEAAELLKDHGNKKSAVFVMYEKALRLGMLGRQKDVAEVANEAWDIAIEINDQSMQEQLDDLFKHLKAMGISKPEKQTQVCLVAKVQYRILPYKVYVYTVVHPEGLSAVPSAKIAEHFVKLPGNIEVEKGDEIVDGESIIDLLSLAATQFSSINIKFSQPQDGHALDPLIQEGIIIPEGTDAYYKCRMCAREVHIRVDTLQSEQVCSKVSAY